MSPDEVRTKLLEAIDGIGEENLSWTHIIEVAAGTSLYGPGAELLLTGLWDLVRSGFLAPGRNVSNPGFTHGGLHLHLTDRGRRALSEVSRSPANPQGYLAALEPNVPSGSVAYSYVEEGLRTYNADCLKAAAVMIGAAAESLLFDLREDVVKQLQDGGKLVPAPLSDWRAKTVLGAIESLFESHKKSMSRDLRERFEGHWSSFTAHLRLTRNEAGHPTGVASVSDEDVYASLLIFPGLAKLTADLREWLTSPACSL